jgi:hypothetical protein
VPVSSTPVRKELRPVHDNVACDVCGRTILKGERTEAFLAPGGQRHTVCELCFSRAAQAGWIRESASGEVPTRMPRPEPRRPLLGRLLGRRPDRRPTAPPEPGGNGAEVPERAGDEGSLAELSSRDGPLPDADVEPPAPRAPAPFGPRRRFARDPRHVTAVPTTGEVKVERALELFNGSDHQRTVAGLTRTLGAPWVSAAPDLEAPSMVNVVVAWELSWYHFRIDLGDEADPIALLEKGEQLDEIGEPLREWNATVDADGNLVAGVGSKR